MDKKLNDILGKSLIYLVSDNKLDRMSWKKAFNSLAVKPEQVVFFEDIDKALRSLESRPPQIMICAYEIKEKFADELLEAYRAVNPNRAQGLCLIVTEQEDPRAYVHKLELELDGILQKPYNAQDLDSRIRATLVRKANLQPARKAIFKGYELLRQNKLDLAGELIERLESEVPWTHDLALLKASYLSQSKKGLDAIPLYEEAMKVEENYTALRLLFDTMVAENQHEKAFAAASEMLKKYPMHPGRLSNFIKVCILTGNYHAFVDYARNSPRDAFGQEHDNQLAAGLAICAKSIGIADRKASIKASISAVRLGKEKAQIVDQALRNLVNLQEYKLVNELVEELSESEELEEAMEQALAVAEYRSLEGMGEAGPFLIFQKGMELTNKGIHDFYVYDVLLKSAKLAGRKKASLEEMADNAGKHHPDKKAYFWSLVN